ncbi:unnamed protein product, partial [Allacma fusca]
GFNPGNVKWNFHFGTSSKVEIGTDEWNPLLWDEIRRGKFQPRE